MLNYVKDSFNSFFNEPMGTDELDVYINQAHLLLKRGENIKALYYYDKYTGYYGKHPEISKAINYVYSQANLPANRTEIMSLNKKIKPAA